MALRVTIKNRSLDHWLCLSNLLALVFYFMHVAIGQNSYPDYNWLSQAVSDLTAHDSPAFLVASPYSALYGLFACIGCLLLSLLLRNKYNKPLRLGIYLFTAMHFLSNVGYTLFPLSGKGYQGQFQDIMHVYVVTLGVVLLSILSLILIAVGGLRAGGSKTIGVLALVSLLLMFGGSIGMNIVPAAYFGLMERFSVFTVVVYTAILGFFGFKIDQAVRPRTEDKLR